MNEKNMSAKGGSASGGKLSFVIPAYNEEKYIGKCLESVLGEIKKTNFDVEVIVVNNASQDKTREVAQSFQGVIVVDEFNKGLVRARQAGYAASTGDIIANVDSDATLPDGWIEKVFAEFGKDPNLVALSGPYIYPEMSKFMNLLVRIWYGVGYLIHLFNHYFLHTGAMLQGGNFIVRRSAMKKIGGFDTSIEFYGEDTDVARRIQQVGRVLFTFDLPMYTSSRRFEGDGFWMTGVRYGINHFWAIIFKKPFTKKYNDCRPGDKI